MSVSLSLFRSHVCRLRTVRSVTGRERFLLALSFSPSLARSLSFYLQRGRRRAFTCFLETATMCSSSSSSRVGLLPGYSSGRCVGKCSSSSTSPPPPSSSAPVWLKNPANRRQSGGYRSAFDLPFSLLCLSPVCLLFAGLCRVSESSSSHTQSQFPVRKVLESWIVGYIASYQLETVESLVRIFY